MKKLLWPAVSIVAIANLLALLGFVGFLVATDRIDRARLNRIRTILAVTIAQEQAAAAAEQEAAAQEAARAKREAETDVANAGVEAREAQFRSIAQTQDEILRRARRDVQAIEQLIALRLAEVERREAELTAREAEVAKAIERDAALARDEQFRKTVTLLSGLKAEDLKAKVDVYLADGLHDFVVDLLVALPSRSASKLLSLYADETENRLAAELLLRLRERGTGADSLRNVDDRLSANQQP